MSANTFENSIFQHDQVDGQVASQRIEAPLSPIPTPPPPASNECAVERTVFPNLRFPRVVPPNALATELIRSIEAEEQIIDSLCHASAGKDIDAVLRLADRLREMRTSSENSPEKC